VAKESASNLGDDGVVDGELELDESSASTVSFETSLVTMPQMERAALSVDDPV
jgi:hypothetical protein